MTRAEACEHIATLMNEWFSDSHHTAEGIAQTLDAVEEDESRIGDSTMWYAVFAMEVLKRAGLVVD